MNLFVNDFFTYANPASPIFEATLNKYEMLKLSEKILVVSLSILAGLSSVFAGGIFGVYVFSKTVRHFSVRSIEDKSIVKSNSIASEIIIKDQSAKPLTVDKASKLSVGELLMKSKPYQLVSDTLGVTKFKSEVFHAHLTHEEKEIRGLINGKLNIFFDSLATTKEVKNPDKYLDHLKEKLENFLDRYCNSPFKFLHFVQIAATSLTDLNRFPLYAWEVLGKLKWPTEDLKSEHLNEILSPVFQAQHVFCNCAEWKTHLDKSGIYSHPFPLMVKGNDEFIADFQQMIGKIEEPKAIESGYLNITEEDVCEYEEEMSKEQKLLIEMVTSGISAYISEKYGPHIAKDLNTLIKPYLETPSLFIYLCDIISHQLCGKNCSLVEMEQVFSKLNWPNEELKEEQINDLVTSHLYDNIFSVEIEVHNGSGYIKLFNIFLNSIFGSGKIKVPDTSHQALCKKLGNFIIDRSGEASDYESAGDFYGIKIVCSTENQEIKAPLLVFLDSLKKIPEIVSIDLEGWGAATEYGNCLGYGDGLADSLIDFITAMPALLELKINDLGMPQNTKQLFWDKVNDNFQAKIAKLKKESVD